MWKITLFLLSPEFIVILKGNKFHRVTGIVSMEIRRPSSPEIPSHGQLCWQLLFSIYFLSSSSQPPKCSQRASCHHVRWVSHRPRQSNFSCFLSTIQEHWGHTLSSWFQQLLYFPMFSSSLSSWSLLSIEWSCPNFTEKQSKSFNMT